MSKVEVLSALAIRFGLHVHPGRAQEIKQSVCLFIRFEQSLLRSRAMLSGQEGEVTDTFIASNGSGMQKTFVAVLAQRVLLQLLYGLGRNDGVLLGK